MLAGGVVFVPTEGVRPGPCWFCDPTAGPVRDGLVVIAWTTRAGTDRAESCCPLCLTEALYHRERDRHDHTDRVTVQLPADGPAITVRALAEVLPFPRRPAG